jgi:hypothetical protein
MSDKMEKSKTMKIEDKSSVPVSNATRARLNKIKFDCQSKHGREFNLDDIVRQLIACYEKHGVE